MWDRLSTHLSKTMNTLVAEREWLTVVLLPGYTPELNPVEGLWAHIKRSPANLAARTLTELETHLRRRLKALQYRHSVLGGFLAETGLTLDRPGGPRDTRREAVMEVHGIRRTGCTAAPCRNTFNGTVTTGLRILPREATATRNRWPRVSKARSTGSARAWSPRWLR